MQLLKMAGADKKKLFEILKENLNYGGMLGGGVLHSSHIQHRIDYIINKEYITSITLHN